MMTQQRISDRLELLSQQMKENFINIEDNSLIKILSAEQLEEEAMSMEELKPLYEPYFYEGECSILFADTNAGKSILSVQIADEISRKGYTVLYLDFEMSMRQFASRCRNENGEVYKFHKNFLRGSINLDVLKDCDGSNYEQELISSIESRIDVYKPQVVIIDNLTYLCLQSESGAEAGQLMRKLLEIKNKYGVSMLVISHTPKRSMSDAITENSLAGSKRIANFADSMFAIGKSSQGDNLRYIKQIKSRSGEIVHGATNVQVCHIERIDGLLRFIIDSEDYELSHLKRNNQQSSCREEQIMQLLQEGKSIRNICQELSVSPNKVVTIRNKMKSALSVLSPDNIDNTDNIDNAQ